MTAPAIAPMPQPTRRWPPEQGQWTYEDWLHLPSDNFRYEVLNGELFMTPPPTLAHQSALEHLSHWMGNFVREHHLGVVLFAPVGVRLPGQPVPVQPDLLFVRQERRNILGDDYVEGAPDLVIEILSPSNWPYDRGEKFEAYRQAGVREYWIVDYRARTIEVFALERSAYALTGKFGAGEAARSIVLSGFQIDVNDLFSE